MAVMVCLRHVRLVSRNASFAEAKGSEAWMSTNKELAQIRALREGQGPRDLAVPILYNIPRLLYVAFQTVATTATVEYVIAVGYRLQHVIAHDRWTHPRHQQTFKRGSWCWDKVWVKVFSNGMG